MFTGLIENVGRVERVTRGRGGARLSIACALPVGQMRAGESVAVDGACLTATALTSGGFAADVVPETIARTTLGRLRAGSRVNLERALRVGDRLGGHLVQGHVDTVAELLRRSSRGDDVRLRFRLPAEVRRYVAFKGSIALHGVSLTIAALGADWFEVALVPHTLEHTTLGRLRAGAAVNVEVDLLARYLEALVDPRRASGHARRAGKAR